MKTKVTINRVEYNFDLEKAQELGVLEKENKRCKTWEEFMEKHRNSIGYVCTNANNINEKFSPFDTREQLTQEEALAIAAFSKLLKLRRDWIGDWEPDWCSGLKYNYCIIVYSDCLKIACYSSFYHTFSFPTKEMAQEFLKCFENLFNQCKNIL